MKKLARSRVQSIFIAVLTTSLILVTTACPSDDAIRKAARASHDLANLTDTVVAAVRTAFEAGQISKPTKDKMADALIIIAKEGKTFNDLLIASQALVQNGKFPPDVITRLSTQFDKVVQPFLDLLTQLNLLGPTANQKLVQTFAGLRAAILIISAVFK